MSLPFYVKGELGKLLGMILLTDKLTFVLEPSVWSKKNHLMFKESSQREMKEVILLSMMKRNGCLLTLLPLDLIWIICQFIPSSSEVRENVQVPEQMKVTLIFLFNFDLLKEQNENKKPKLS